MKTGTERRPRVRSAALFLAALQALAAGEAREAAEPLAAAGTAGTAGTPEAAEPAEALPASAAKESPEARDARMAWFREARFGLFIHWGIYSVPAGEWKGNTGYGEWFLEETRMPVSEYEAFARQFNPVKFDAKEWVRIAKDAGMKYIVITSKHHDGFGMFRSELTDWCIKSTPFERDPLKELAAACKEQGMVLCFYHSIMDWRHPDWGTRRPWNDRATGTPDMDRYVAFMKGQLEELLTGYGPIGILWFDGEWESPWTHERGVDLDRFVRRLQPSIIVNNRVGKGRAGMSGMDQGKGVGDYGTPEQEIPPTGFGPGVDWESCMTMNGHWGYNKADQNWKSARTLLRNLIDCASKGGNYLLNVGPTSEGLIPDPSVERLAAIGAWMEVNGESIHGTAASPFKKLRWGKCTRKPGRLYLHVFDWPADGRLLVPVSNEVKRAVLLSDRTTALEVEEAAAGWIVRVPATAPDPDATVIAVEIDGEPRVDEAALIIQPAADGSITLLAADADYRGAQIRFEAGDRRDCVGFWLDPSEWVEWSFQATAPGTFRVTAEIAALGSGSFEVVIGDADPVPTKPGDDKPGDAKPGDAKPADAKPGAAKPGGARPGDAPATLRGKAPATGDYGRFVKVDLGVVELAKAGKTPLAVKAIREGWQPFNLRAVTLAPAR